LDNLKYYDTSLAYNFELFMPAEKKKAEVLPMPTNKNHTKRRAKTKAKARPKTKLGLVAITALFLIMLCCNLVLRAQITATESKINDINKQIATMESEATRISVALEKKLSYSNLEQEAYSLGMRKMDKSQVVYIKTNEQNKAITKGGLELAENN